MGMGMRDVRSAPEWRSELERLCVGCGTAPASESADWLLRAYRIFIQMPQPLCMTLPDYADFLALIGVGASESGALSLMPKVAGYMVSSGPTGTCIASVILPGASVEATSEGDTVALALVGAYAAALLRWNDAHLFARDKANPGRPLFGPRVQ